MVSEHQDKTNLPLPLTSDVLKTIVEVAVREAIAALFPSFVAQVSVALARETTASEGLTFKFEATGNQSVGNSFVPENFMSGFENTTRFDDISESRRIPIPSHGYLGGENSERQQILHQPLMSQSLSTSIEGGAKWLVNKVKGKMQKPLPELLKEYDLAIGIFPRDATNYEFNEETGKLTVYIPSICEVGYRDSSVLRFSTIVCGYLERGKLVDIEGMKTKMIVWVKVTCISSDKSKLNFSAGMKKSRGKDAYEVLRDGVVVDKF